MFSNLFSIAGTLPVWALWGGIALLSAVTIWTYLRILRFAPFLNLLVLLTGIVFLAWEPISAFQSESMEVLQQASPGLHLLMALGVFLISLSAAGMYAIRYSLKQERKLRQLWDRVCEQEVPVAMGR